ncbi:MAG: Twin-arginine translocation protein TatA [uncultured Campylobacterales bacterium]|uniref:Sec-independent protein translocase protein TatA n=1 Tax=uncultured Campylobacterales bacterium TaxID=352960 RepID=A0A6S6RWD5_9BACT|nr:MAG: Twin-arginine translocation protein TatA [uncultured Campylobacterales bacterium]
MMPGMTEIVIILAIVILLFGGKKIPELAKGLGRGIKDFKKALKDDTKEEDTTTKTQKEKVETKDS